MQGFEQFQIPWVHPSINVHYSHSHFDRFTENLGDTSEEQERWWTAAMKDGSRTRWQIAAGT